jgi:PAS domain S-box-containing protein
LNSELRRHYWSRRAFVLLAGVFSLGAIIFLGSNVAREIQLLQSSQSDNIQWALSQTEVEFLEYRDQVTSGTTDIVELRLRFDVFYSRVSMIQSATVFESQRKDETFNDHLRAVRSFLDTSAEIVDLADSDLLQMIPRLAEMAAFARTDVRSLSNSALRSFAKAADQKRYAVLRTLLELGATLAVLIGALAICVIYLNWINSRSRKRQMALRRAMQRMDTITSTSLDGVIVSNTSGQILEFNAAAEIIFGHLAKDVIGRDLGPVIIPDHLLGLHDAGMERMRKLHQTGGWKRSRGDGGQARRWTYFPSRTRGSKRGNGWR